MVKYTNMKESQLFIFGFVSFVFSHSLPVGGGSALKHSPLPAKNTIRRSFSNKSMTATWVLEFRFLCAAMTPSLALFFLLGLASSWSCVQGSIGDPPEPTATPGAAGCGCGNPKRAAVEDDVDGATPAGSAVKYSRGASTRDQKQEKSPVICRLQLVLQLMFILIKLSSFKLPPAHAASRRMH